MKRLAVLAGFALVLCAEGSAASSRPVFAIVGKKISTQQLVRVDAGTLRPLGQGLLLAGQRYGRSFSADGRLLALGSGDMRCGKLRTTLRIADVLQMKTVGQFEIADSGPVQASAWLARNRLAAVVGPGRCGSATQTRAVVVDPVTGRVVARTWIRGNVIASGRAPGALVLLLEPPQGLGSARVVVVSADGRVRQKVLEGVPAGTPRYPFRTPVSTPGLAVDGTAMHAFVVTGADRMGVTEVDLRTMRVAYHRLTERTLAKGVTGSQRQAVWLGGGLLAVTGIDTFPPGVVPAGLRVVDTRAWRSRTIDRDVSHIDLAGNLILAEGGSYSVVDGSSFTGLIAFSRSGRERYRIFDGLPVSHAAVIAGRGYATVGGTTYKNRTIEFDLVSGKVGRSLDQPLWELVLPTG